MFGFLDIQFHRKEGKWNNECYYNYNFEEWKDTNKKTAVCDSVQPEYLAKHRTFSSFEKQKKKILGNLKWLLGKNL